MNRIFLLALLSITSSLIAIFSVSAIITNPIFAQKSMQIYENEKCGVSIQYPKDWVATESNSVFENKSRTISDFQSEDEDVLGLSFAIENMGLAKKSITEVSEWFREYWVTSPESGILSSEITEINGFPAYEITYYEGLAGDYEFQDEKYHTMEVVIIAYDREYVLRYEAPNKTDFDKYSSIVEEMANSIKITQPNFEGVNC